MPTNDYSTEDRENSIQKISTIDYLTEDRENSILKMPTIDICTANQKNCIQNIPSSDFSADSKVDLWNDPVVHGLVEALRVQHHALLDVYSELEAERSASASSIDDALLMISRLQDEKARLAMEAAQFKREAQEKIRHAQATASFYEEVLFRKDEDVKALLCEVEAFKHRFLSYGVHNETGYGFWHCDADGSVGIPENSLVGRNASANHDGSAGFAMRRSCERCSEFKLEDCTSKEMGRPRIMGFSEAVERSYCDQGEESDSKHVNAIERARHFPEEVFSGHIILLWERIEGLQKRLHLLSEKKTVNCNFKDEWGSTHEELENALTSYITSLRQGLKSHWRGLVAEGHEANVTANTDQTDGPVDVYIDTTRMGERQQKSDSFIQTHEEGFSQVSTVENRTLEQMENKIKDLCLRIHTLEDDGKYVKQVMDSLKRQQYSIKYFKQIVQGIHKSEEPPKGQINVKILSPQKVVSITSLIKYFFSQLPVGVRGILSFVLFRIYKHVQSRMCILQMLCPNLPWN